MAVSRTLSFVVGLALAGMAAFAALGDDDYEWSEVFSDATIVGVEHSSPQFPADLTQIAGSALHVNGVPVTPEQIQLHDISARLDRIEKLLREMCERTARFAGCEELRKQR